MRNRTTIAALTVGLTLGFAAHAAEPASPQAEATAPNAVIARDPATGQLRAPTAAEIKALQTKQATMRTGTASARPRNSVEAARTTRTAPNGTVSMMVPEDVMSSVVATRQADGSIKIGHAGEAGPVSTVEQVPTK